MAAGTRPLAGLLPLVIMAAAARYDALERAERLLGEEGKASADEQAWEHAKTRLKEEEAEMFTWSYNRSSARGPQYWGNFSTTCSSGELQSPIDLSSKEGKPMGKFRPLEFSYNSAGLWLKDDGKVLRGDWEGDDNVMRVFKNGGRHPFTLRFIEFHTPSEHTIDGAHSDAELQLVHKGPDGRLAIVSVLLNIGETTNPFMQKLWGRLPRNTKDEPAQAEVDPNLLLPSGSFFAQKGAESYYSYMGSLTSPPCDEGVHWYILQDQGVVTSAQLEMMKVDMREKLNRKQVAMEKLYINLATEKEEVAVVDEGLTTARPTQPWNGRKVFFDNMEASRPYHTIVEPSKKIIKEDKQAVRSKLQKEHDMISVAKSYAGLARQQEEQLEKDRQVYSDVVNNETIREDERVQQEVKAIVSKKKIAVANATQHKIQDLKRKLQNETATALKREEEQAKQIADLKEKLKEQQGILKDKVAEAKLEEVKNSKVEIKNAKQEQLQANAKVFATASSALKDAEQELHQEKKTLASVRPGDGTPAPDQTLETDEDAEVMDELREARAFEARTVQGQIVFPDEETNGVGMGYVKLRRVDGQGEAKMAMLSNNNFKIDAVEPGDYRAESVVRGYDTQSQLLHVGGDEEVPPLAFALSSKQLGRDLEVGEGEGAARDLGESSDVTEQMTVPEEEPEGGMGVINGAVSVGENPVGAADLLGYVRVRHCCQRSGKVLKMGVVQHGTFSVQGLRAGSYTLETYVPGHPAQYKNVVLDEYDPKNIQVVI